MTQENTLPTVEQIRELLAGKQYFDNEYHPSDFVDPYMVVGGESEAEQERRTR